MLVNSATKGLRKKDRYLWCDLIQADDAEIVRSGLSSRSRGLVTARNHNRPVAVDAACEIGAQNFIHTWNYTNRPQLQRLGTVKQLGSVLGRQMGARSKGGDWSAWPESLRVREFPLGFEAVHA
jgi:hypothetical protein